MPRRDYLVEEEEKSRKRKKKGGKVGDRKICRHGISLLGKQGEREKGKVIAIVAVVVQEIKNVSGCPKQLAMGKEEGKGHKRVVNFFCAIVQTLLFYVYI